MAVLGAARQYEAAADLVDTAHGDALRLAIDDVVDRLHEWALAATEIAAELRSCVDRYVDVDARGARRIG